MTNRNRGRAWLLADQGLSSATNFIATWLAARMLSLSELGAFSLGFLVYALALVIARSGVLELLLIRSARRDELHNTDAVSESDALAVIAVLSGVLALGTVAAAPLFGHEVRPALTVLGVTLPLLLMQDAVRFIFIRQRRYRALVATDASWMLSIGAIAFIALGMLTATAATLLLIWSLGTIPSIIHGFVSINLRETPSLRRWWQNNGRLASSFVLDGLMARAAGSIVMVAIAGLGGLSTLGAIRAGEVAFGPVNVAFMGLRTVWLAQPSPLDSLSALARRAITAASIPIGWGMALMVSGPHVGELFLGRSWPAASLLLVPFAVMKAAEASVHAASTDMRKREASRALLQARSVGVAALLVGGVAGLSVGGAVPIAWGLAIGQTMAAAVWSLYAGIVQQQR